MAERKFDQALRIRTAGIREWRDRSVPYHRYEATPYEALETLFQHYKIRQTDRVVDFGCGRGRVSFYIHNRFKVPVKGIEVNELTFAEALDNKAVYRQGAGHISAPIRFMYGLAEQYEVKPIDTKFYFFNPFSVKIFKQVVQNIINSVKTHPRSVDLILYYPTAEYKSFLKKSTPFKLISKVKVPEAQDQKEKFLIYRISHD